MYKVKSIDVIVPCFNPELNWADQVIFNFNELQKHLPSIKFQLYVIDDASSVTLQPELSKIKNKIGGSFKFISYNENKGKGYAIRCGVKESNSDAIIYTDIDFPYVTKDLIAVAEKLINGNDLVVSVRSEKYYSLVPKRRTMLSKISRFLLKHLLRLKVTDTQCGLKGFSKNAKGIFLNTKINRFLFDMEFIYKFGKSKNLSYTTLNVNLREGVIFSKMNFKIILNEGLNFLWICLFGK